MLNPADDFDCIVLLISGRPSCSTIARANNRGQARSMISVAAFEATDTGVDAEFLGIPGGMGYCVQVGAGAVGRATRSGVLPEPRAMKDCNGWEKSHVSLWVRERSGEAFSRRVGKVKFWLVLFV